jgi:hypothetical protein
VGGLHRGDARRQVRPGDEVEFVTLHGPPPWLRPLPGTACTCP